MRRAIIGIQKKFMEWSMEVANWINIWVLQNVWKYDCWVFPNIYQHKVEPFKLIDPSKPRHRKFLVYFVYQRYSFHRNNRNGEQSSYTRHYCTNYELNWMKRLQDLIPIGWTWLKQRNIAKNWWRHEKSMSQRSLRPI